MSKILFVGELPPPYGGVAVKDKLIYQEVYAPLGAKMLDLVECRRKPWKIPFIGVCLCWRLVTARYVVIGVGTDRRRKILLWMRKCLRGKGGLKSTFLLIMGGRLHLAAEKDERMRKSLCDVGKVWVETEGMVQRLRALGISSATLFPNCRSGTGALPPMKTGKKIKFVYFSRICMEKGIDDVFQALPYLSGDYSLDIYGEVDKGWKENFENLMKNHPEVKYHGVFDSINGNVYKELNQYDVILFPSHWAGEGVPGALVESKMAGITAIVSNWNFNAEVILHDVEGIVLQKREELVKAMQELISNHEKLDELKKNAYLSRNRYLISAYEQVLLDCVF